MKTPHVIMLTAVAVTVAAAGSSLSKAQPAPADRAAGEMLGTLQQGTYQCALPGDAGGPAFVVVEAEGFRIGTASRYESAQGAGTYILRGKEMAFTTGPRKGEQFHRIGTNQLRKLEADGTQSELLCTRLVGER